MQWGCQLVFQWELQLEHWWGFLWLGRHWDGHWPLWEPQWWDSKWWGFLWGPQWVSLWGFLLVLLWGFPWVLR